MDRRRGFGVLAYFVRGRRGRRDISTLILLRHGQSEWNSPTPTFTGWADVDLTEAGRREARDAGLLIAKRCARVDFAFTSELRRAHETAAIVLDAVAEAAAAAPGAAAVATRDLRFNERHYGAVQGICKNDAALHAVYGTATVKLWRRSMHAAPPPVTEDHPHWLPPPAPRTESLSDCRERCLSGFDARVWPALFDSGQRGSTVLLVAHANTLRALMSSFDGIADEDIPKLHVPNSVPIIYRFDEETRMPLSRKLGSAAGGSHARWLLSHTNHHKIEAALQPGGMLTRALFESWDEDGNRSLTASEIRRGLKSLSAADVGVAAVARRIVRNLTLKFDVGEGSEICTLEEFEATAKRVGSRLADELEDVDDLEKTGYNEYVKPGYAGPAPN